MKTFVYFIFTICISCGLMMAATNTKQFSAKAIFFLIAFGIWVPFFRGWNNRMKRYQQRKSEERGFQEYMRNKMRNQRY
ncbi:hypothetical protein SAMN05192574_101694 [Mucilaginibacter gossypiicola]|uniref:Uncharacterized protein n=1 Tax=Mucilaginibacter gossypiicola TaxID=551995 RepID=A0A1H8AZT4_9SPHI|nr:MULTISPECIES: hypothetical protein [Mucilaginibacter]UOE52223.1 hypothetical protein MTO98_14150 [Mucilaginibacter sp. SMC90]SEM75047.1 hypothetical protein SAMN05192574_101694 [Mucilaginibacter gossypiicola]